MYVVLGESIDLRERDLQTSLLMQIFYSVQTCERERERERERED